jgi:hypothetical protein
VFAFFAASIIISSCSKYNEEISPSSHFKTLEVVGDANAKLSSAALGTFDCSTLNQSTLTNKYRAKTISIYGADMGQWHNGLANSYKSNPGMFSLNPAYLKVYNYKSQIIMAIQKGAKDLASSYCTANTPACNAQIYWSSYLKDAINVYLNPVKAAISNDGTLSSKRAC